MTNYIIENNENHDHDFQRILAESFNEDDYNYYSNYNRYSNIDNSENIDKFVVVTKENVILNTIKCCVCLENGSNLDTIVFIPCCKYKNYICKECLKRTLSSLGNNCPMCRSNMIESINEFSKLSDIQKYNIIPHIKKNMIYLFKEKLNNLSYECHLDENNKILQICFKFNKNNYNTQNNQNNYNTQTINILYKVINNSYKEFIYFFEKLKKFNENNYFESYYNLIKILSRISCEYNNIYKTRRVNKEKSNTLIEKFSSNCFNMLI